MDTTPGISTILLRAVEILRDDPRLGPRLCNRWLPASSWVEALAKSDAIDNELVKDVNTRRFNKAMSSGQSEWSNSMACFDGSNNTGVFRVKYQKTLYYFLTARNKQVPYPFPLDDKWKESVCAIAKTILQIPTTRSRPAGDEAVEPDVQHIEGSPSKRQRTEEPHQEAKQLSYWPDSPEAYQLFKPRQGVLSTGQETYDGSENPQEAVERRIEILKSANQSEDGWRNIIAGRDPKNFCSKTEIFEVRQRAIFLCSAYQLALDHMNDWTWHECCKQACTSLNNLGLTQATSYKTVANWNILFRSLENFPHPNPYVQCGKWPMPKLFEAFPSAKDDIASFAVRKLATLTIEEVHEFISTLLIPKLMIEWKKDNANNLCCDDVVETRNLDNGASADDTSMQLFLNAHGLKTLSMHTVWRWMHLLGFKHDSRKKSFYVDGHERDDVVDSRRVFCRKYLTEYEPRCRRWIQLSQEEAKVIEGIDIEFGFCYDSAFTNEPWVEFHVDYWEARTRESHDLRSSKIPDMSIRSPQGTRPIMIVGQDESVFSQYLLGSKTWVGPKGQRPLLPKSEGDGYMLSAFVSRDFGFGRPLTNSELQAINATRLGKQYLDGHAAYEVLKTYDKPPLTCSPFVKYLFIGANNEGYWNSFHMALQFEDVVDCLKVLYPEFEFVFLFDHSQGHARKRNGALDAKQMSKNFGGAQPPMRETTILSDEGFLGPFTPMLGIGDTQSMVFKPSDIGPWYLGSDEEREMRRHDQPTGKTKRIERTKKLLVEALELAGVTLQKQRNHTKKELQEYARINGVDVYYDKTEILQGWEGQPKGLLQVLWERGLIADSKEELSSFTIDGRKDPITGILDTKSSLRHLLANCQDFREEETALQNLGAQLGVTVQLTPKFHAELAGEGVEYCWAHAKSFYRRKPVSSKRGRENFKCLVKDCTSPDEILTRERVQKFAARARAYICTYYHLDLQQQGLNSDDVSVLAQKQELLYAEIERLMKDFKVHRCALDFDRGFVNSELKHKAVVTRTNR